MPRANRHFLPGHVAVSEEFKSFNRFAPFKSFKTFKPSLGRFNVQGSRFKVWALTATEQDRCQQSAISSGYTKVEMADSNAVIWWSFVRHNAWVTFRLRCPKKK